MLEVHVHIRVNPADAAAFEQASLANALASRWEPGVDRFDLLRDREDSTSFVLVETYADQSAVDAHKQTEHYAVWRDTVAPMMAEPRRAVWYETYD
jgi:quinol monooxygenase YgiN